MGEPIRVLHILQRMEAGGTQALLMNIYRKIDRTKVQFDFLVVYKEKQFYDDEIEKMGGHVYKLSFREDLNLPKFQKDLAVFFAQHHEYKIVHCHAYTIGYFCLKAAKKAGIPVRIAHSHNNETVHDIKYLPKLFMQRMFGKEKVVLYSEIAGMIVDIILNALLIPKMASTGAAIGTLAAEIAVFIVQYVALRGIIKEAYRQVHYVAIGSSVLAGGVLAVLIKRMQWGSFMTLCASAIVFFGVYFLILTIAKESLVIEIENQLLGRIIKKK